MSSPPKAVSPRGGALTRKRLNSREDASEGLDNGDGHFRPKPRGGTPTTTLHNSPSSPKISSPRIPSPTRTLYKAPSSPSLTRKNSFQAAVRKSPMGKTGFTIRTSMDGQSNHHHNNNTTGGATEFSLDDPFDPRSNPLPPSAMDEMFDDEEHYDALDILGGGLGGLSHVVNTPSRPIPIPDEQQHKHNSWRESRDGSFRGNNKAYGERRGSGETTGTQGGGVPISTTNVPPKQRSQAAESFERTVLSMRERTTSDAHASLSGTAGGTGGEEESRMIKLDRGGVVVKTSIGLVQFGIPPETIKDTLNLGLEVPRYYVIPPDRFDRRRGLSMCEVEFPGYYSFFLKGRNVVLIATRDVEAELRPVLHETLLGPPEPHLYANEELASSTPTDVFFSTPPDLVKEMAYFVLPRNNRNIEVDSLYEFCTMEAPPNPFGSMSSLETEEVVVQDNNTNEHNTTQQPSPPQPVEPLDSTRRRKIWHGDLEPRYMATLPTLVLTPNHPNLVKIQSCVDVYEFEREWHVYDRGVRICVVPKYVVAAPVVERLPASMPPTIFTPPMFGITILGSSHGFDRLQTTSGFVLWMNGKGIVVDPPPNTTELLRKWGIPPRMVNSIILTHCHADHDAGTFQKILVEGRVTLLTTKTIMASFLRKYSRISGFTEAFLCRLFEPRIVRIGEHVFHAGGTLRFFYSLHALPCVGFIAEAAGKSFAYSADTFYDPESLVSLRDKGVLSHQRCEALLNFPFETTDCVLHEAGIPPIHTPLKVLQNLSDVAKERLYVIHVADKDVENSGLRLARPGPENTIRIVDVVDGDLQHEMAHVLDVLASSEIFKPASWVFQAYGGSVVAQAAQSHMDQRDDRASMVSNASSIEPDPGDYGWLDAAYTEMKWSASRITRAHTPSVLSATKSLSGDNNNRSSTFFATVSPADAPMYHRTLGQRLSGGFGVPRRSNLMLEAMSSFGGGGLFGGGGTSQASQTRTSGTLSLPSARSPQRTSAAPTAQLFERSASDHRMGSGLLFSSRGEDQTDQSQSGTVGRSGDSVPDESMITPTASHNVPDFLQHVGVASRRSSGGDDDMDLFDEFSVPQAADILRLCRRVTKRAGEVLSAKKGEIDTCLMIIIRGFAYVRYDANSLPGQQSRSRRGSSLPTFWESPSIPVSNTLMSEVPASSSITAESAPSSQAILLSDVVASGSEFFTGGEKVKGVVGGSVPTSSSSATVEESPEARNGTLLEGGDFFGRLYTAQGGGKPRRSEIVALSDVTMVVLDDTALRYLCPVYPGLEKRLNKIQNARITKSWSLLDNNSCLSRLAPFQRSQLLYVLHERRVPKGEKLWWEGKPTSHAYLVAQGKLGLELEQGITPPVGTPAFIAESSGFPGEDMSIKQGAWVCHVQSLLNQRTERLIRRKQAVDPNFPMQPPDSGKDVLNLVALTDCVLYAATSRDALEFLERNPGVLVQSFHTWVLV